MSLIGTNPTKLSPNSADPFSSSDFFLFSFLALLFPAAEDSKKVLKSTVTLSAQHQTAGRKK